MEHETYYFSKVLNIDFDMAIARVTEELAKEGFGVLTDIDVKATMKKKLDIDFRPYRILGACHPPSAYKALMAEDKIGTLLPCNFIVQQFDNGSVEVAGIDPIRSMAAVYNTDLSEIANEVKARIKKVVESL